MKRQYILKLGELHDIFSHAHAIGNLIGSGLEDTWAETEWFDSKSVVQQVLDCKHMARAIEAHKATRQLLKSSKLEKLCLTLQNFFVGVAGNIAQTVNKAITSMEVSKDSEFRDVFFTLKSLLSTMN